GFGPAYKDIAAARKKYGQGSDEEFEVVSKYMNQTAQKAGALSGNVTPLLFFGKHNLTINNNGKIIDHVIDNITCIMISKC
ncbi:hypothetical protein, partial [Pantoea agglomerans]|uniref:hypothetical protein n=1 Tax=Enterobacter agglomerans TaxID=549 RepID=UPI001A8F5015